ncbi:hypothetical protein M2163_004399 [Streptomyces sp. SAI-135]|jgi:hypothetical protein|uniref:hypothetical protein n=1 Tax=unclassified Streptomyces TaxID=2593676 RepID=UPI0024732197|nr:MULTISPECIES: hypothetical protein [unclassified Streptomyces]MDH6518614.1 hypothetical protein [Streptomyces sp. SAI-090]MDH6617291.1 hypothetical protein [Streptomyces sp. SAI-135]
MPLFRRAVWPRDHRDAQPPATMAPTTEESLGQQVTDLLDVDSYVKMHTVWAGHMLMPTTDFLTASC